MQIGLKTTDSSRDWCASVSPHFLQALLAGN